jgi:hypothetical protein
MSINNHWRNKQLGNNLLWQEIQCLNFLKRHPTITWQWHGTKGNFFKFCQNQIKIDSSGSGLIVINYPTGVTAGQFVSTINQLLDSQPKSVYLAVNRYEFLSTNDLNIDYPEQIEDCINVIVSRCAKSFQRLYRPAQVDGKHFVGVHGLDVFVYENN